MTRHEKEPRFYNSQDGEIEYHRVGDELWYAYQEEDIRRTGSGASSHRRYKIQGVIPAEVIEQGEAAVKEFAKTQVEIKLIAEKEEDRQRRERRDKLRHPLEFIYEEVLLKGQLRTPDSTVLTAELLEPYQGEKNLYFGYASAMGGHFILGKDGYFTESTIKDGERMLIDIYRAEKERAEHKDIDDLTKRLNRGRG